MDRWTSASIRGERPLMRLCSDDSGSGAAHPFAAMHGCSVAIAAVRSRLRDGGYIEGRNIIFERRYADGTLERLPDLAAEQVRLRVDVIVAGTNPAIAAAKRATATIPIVMIANVDPVG